MYPASTSLPNLKLGAIVDFVVSGPGEQTRMVEKIRKMYLDEASRPWFYYDPMIAGIRRAIMSADPEAVIESVIGDVDDPAKAAHYRELGNGFLSWLAKNRVSLVSVGSANWTDGTNTITVNPQIALRLNGGSARQAVFLYMKKPPLTQAAANIPLRMLHLAMPEVLPDGEATILDVRRGKLFRLRANGSEKRLDASVAGTVANLVAIWQAIA